MIALLAWLVVGVVSLYALFTLVVLLAMSAGAWRQVLVNMSATERATYGADAIRYLWSLWAPVWVIGFIVSILYLAVR